MTLLHLLVIHNVMKPLSKGEAANDLTPLRNCRLPRSCEPSVSLQTLPPHPLPAKPKSTSAFTLIELSIVLVIIGLIVGGVLVGRDLIQAASNRQVISDVQKFQTAISTFKDRYHYLPGDVPEPYASSFFGAYGSSSPCNPGAGMDGEQGGDGNGVISNNPAGAWEPALFWCQLGKTGFIAGSYVGTSMTGPKSSYSDNAYFGLPIGNNSCGFDLSDSCIQLSLANDDNGQLGVVVPIDAQSIDQKMDDGM